MTIRSLLRIWSYLLKKSLMGNFIFCAVKISIIHTLLHRCFWICSDWTKFHFELVKLRDVFKSNGYPEKFINNSFKVFLDNKHRIQENVRTVPKKSWFLALSYLGPLSFKTRTKLKKSLKLIINCCKLHLRLRVKTN